MILIDIFVFLIGAIIGSFLNVVIFRLHAEKSLLGRSLCLHCKRKIGWYDNIPVISYLILRGKCRACKDSISLQYPMVEFVTGILFLLTYYSLQPLLSINDIIHLFTYFVFISILVVIFVYDLRWYLILDVVTLPAIVFAFVANVLLGISWWSLVLAGILGGGFFLLQFLISRGKWIGGGDIRLGFLMGVMLGFPMIVVTLMLAYILGTLISLPLVVVGKRHMGDKIPFGTFLSIATIVSIIWGNELLTWYLAFLHI